MPHQSGGVGGGGFGRNHKVVLSQDVALGLLALGALQLLVREHGLSVDARGLRNKCTPLLAMCWVNSAESAELVGALVALAVAASGARARGGRDKSVFGLYLTRPA